MKKRNAQTTVFIIIAVIVVAIVIGIVYLQTTQKSSDMEKVFSKLGITSQASVAQQSIQECLKDVSEGALTVIGIQGGYYNKPQESFDLGWAFIPYYYNEGKFSMPSTKTIEDELADYIDDNLGVCIETLEFEDFTASYQQSKTSAEIKKQEVEFTIDTKLTLTKQDLSAEYELKNQPINIESQINDMIKIAKYYTDSHKEDSDMICISCLADMAEEDELFIDMLDFEDGVSTLVVISNNQTSEPNVFEFLNKYPEETEETLVE